MDISIGLQNWIEQERKNIVWRIGECFLSPRGVDSGYGRTMEFWLSAHDELTHLSVTRFWPGCPRRYERGN